MASQGGPSSGGGARSSRRALQTASRANPHVLVDGVLVPADQVKDNETSTPQGGTRGRRSKQTATRANPLMMVNGGLVPVNETNEETPTPRGLSGRRSKQTASRANPHVLVNGKLVPVTETERDEALTPQRGGLRGRRSKQTASQANPHVLVNGRLVPLNTIDPDTGVSGVRGRGGRRGRRGGRGGGGGGGGRGALGTSNAPDPKLMFEDYQIRMGDGWTVSDQTFDHQPQAKRRKLDVPYPQLVNHTYRARNGLSALQVAHNAPITPSALDIACEHVWKSLHADVRRHVLVAPPNGPDLWSGNQAQVNQMYTKIALPEYRTVGTDEYRFHTEMKQYPWVIWPVWVEDDFGKDWVTILLYSQVSNWTVTPPVFDQLVAYTVIDPRRARYATPTVAAPGNPPAKCDFPRARAMRIDDALRNFLTLAGYDLSHVPMATVQPSQTGVDDIPAAEVERPMTITHCSPMRSDEWTSGERCFATVKELLERIVTWYLAAEAYKAPLEVFRHLKRWVNPFQVRVEMAGINAWVLMATLDYEARITVETITTNDIETVADGVPKRIAPYDLAGPFGQPPLAPNDWKLAGPAPPTRAPNP